MLNRLPRWLTDQRSNLIFIAAGMVAYGVDYAYSLLTGRLLAPAEFGIFVSLTGLAHIFIVCTRPIQTVTTRYIATDNKLEKQAQFWRRSFWYMLLAGGNLFIVLILVGRPIASFLQIDNWLIISALALGVLLMFPRAVADGTLQGLQRFTPYGGVQLLQAFGRFIFGGILILTGWQAFGALLGLPIGSLLALLFGRYALRDLTQQPAKTPLTFSRRELVSYAGMTTVGMIGFALLLNMDAVLVRGFFSAESAGDYGTAVTLGKILQFFPLTFILLMFPKTAQRHRLKQNPLPILLPTFGASLLICGTLTLIFFLFPTQIINLLFGPEYMLDPIVLGLVGLAMTLLACVNIWLNYFLSIDATTYVWFVWLSVIAQALIMFNWHTTLWQLPAAMIANAAALTIAGLLYELLRTRKSKMSQDDHAANTNRKS